MCARGPAPGALGAAGSLDPHPGGRVGAGLMLKPGARSPSVVLLLALHLCVFTMFGLLLFTGEKVLTAPRPSVKAQRRSPAG